VHLDTFISTAIAKLNKKIEDTKESVSSGSIGSMEDYRYVTGKINAYRDDIQLLKELRDQFFETRTIYSGRGEYGNGEPRTY
jgi:hypothetical protein